MKYFIQGQWWTQLGRLIKMNDLVNEMRDLCAQWKKTTTMREMVEKAHAKGLKVEIRLVPKKQSKNYEKNMDRPTNHRRRAGQN